MNTTAETVKSTTKDKNAIFKTSLLPRGKRLLIAKDAKETKSAGGILLPNQVQQEQISGTIVRVGDKCEQNWSQGAQVYFAHVGCLSISDKNVGQDYVIVQEESIVAEVST
jgi:co-chaperonin GroES (HSP10)